MKAIALQAVRVLGSDINLDKDALYDAERATNQPDHAGFTKVFVGGALCMNGDEIELRSLLHELLGQFPEAEFVTEAGEIRFRAFDYLVYLMTSDDAQDKRLMDATVSIDKDGALYTIDSDGYRDTFVGNLVLPDEAEWAELGEARNASLRD